MQISYNKLFKLLIDKGMKKTDLAKEAKLTPATLAKLSKTEGKTIIMVTHDPQMASKCKRILFLKDGVILEDLKRTGESEGFYQEILKRMASL